MAQYFPNGAKFAVATTMGLAQAISAISNANPAVASAVVLPTEMDIVLLDSNWTDLADQPTYATDVGGGAFTLAKIDTTDQGIYFPGEGAGSYKIPGDFVTVSQIREATTSGGDANFFNWGYVDDSSVRTRSRPTDTNPLQLTLTLDWDPDKPWADALELLSKKRIPTVLRERLSTGDILLYAGYVSYQKVPSHTRNENMTVTAVMTINSDPIRFPPEFFGGS